MLSCQKFLKWNCLARGTLLLNILSHITKLSWRKDGSPSPAVVIFFTISHVLSFHLTTYWDIVDKSWTPLTVRERFNEFQPDITYLSTLPRFKTFSRQQLWTLACMWICNWRWYNGQVLSTFFSGYISKGGTFRHAGMFPRNYFQPVLPTGATRDLTSITAVPVSNNTTHYIDNLFEASPSWFIC